jgi:DNA-binding NarL/FixJ family response regulator
VSLALDEPAAAHEALAPLSAFFVSYEPVDPFLLFFMPDHVDALAALGELDDAARITEHFAARAEASRRDWAIAAADRCRALVLAAGGDLDSAEAAAERSVRRYGTLPLPFELGRSLLSLGKIRRRAKRRGTAGEALGCAVEVFEEIGAELWAARARSELGRVGHRAEPDDLTASERRVAELAASGLTNREVAATAFMSQKTVEANLSRVYRKLGIRSRAELGLRLAEREPAQ